MKRLFRVSYSTVPCLSSAVIEHVKTHFQAIDKLIYGITPGQKSPRGYATAASILTYLGKPIKTRSTSNKQQYGWQGLYRQSYPVLGKRWMANCDVPDLDIFPQLYNIKDIRFSAGMESSFLHLGMWGMSWLIRWGMPISLVNYTGLLLKISHFFDWVDTNDGGMHMIFTGFDQYGIKKRFEWYIIAKNGDGPQIPCIPAIVLTKKYSIVMSQ